MREILFRGRRVDPDGKGRFVEGWLFMHEGSLCIQTLAESEYGEFIFQVDPETVGQYTGMTDKNGTKIFEGDIIKVFDPWKKVLFDGEIWFRGSSFQIYAPGGYVKGWYDIPDYTNEVIGNIYENIED